MNVTEKSLFATTQIGNWQLAFAKFFIPWIRSISGVVSLERLLLLLLLLLLQQLLLLLLLSLMLFLLPLIIFLYPSLLLWQLPPLLVVAELLEHVLRVPQTENQVGDGDVSVGHLDRKKSI